MFNNKYPYTDFHELNADWLISKFKEIVDSIETFFTKTTPELITQIVTEQQLPDELNSSRYAYTGTAGELYIYIACNGGDDSNTGKAGSPVKTLQKALEIGSRFHNDFRLYFIEAGDYIWEPLVFTGQSIHIHASVAGVNIISDRDIVLYGSHLNVLGESGHEITFTVNSTSKRFYFDGGQANFTNCIINALLRFNSAGGELTNCTVNHVSVRRGGTCSLIDCKLSDPLLDAAAFDIQNGQIYLYNSFEIIATVNSDSYFINSIGGNFRSQVEIVNTHAITYALGTRMLTGELLIPSSYMDSINSLGPVSLATTVLSNVNNNGNIIDFTSNSTEVTSNSWTTINTVHVDAGSYILRLFISCSNVSADTAGAIKATVGTSNQYEYVNWKSGINGFSQLIVFVNSAEPVDIPIQVQNLSGVTVTCGGKAMYIREL